MQNSRMEQLSPEMREVGFRQLDEFQHQNIIKAKKRPFTNSAMMSTYPPIYLEANMPSLSSIMRTKFLSRQSFSQAEVRNIMQSSIYGLAYLQSKGILFCDMHPSNIFFDQMRNVFKLGNPYFTEPGIQQFRKGKRISFLSPEQITSIYDESFKLTKQMQFKSDVFVLGMHLLQICTLESSETCYNKEMLILDSVVKQRLKVVESLYKGLVLQAIKACLDYTVQTRPSPIQLAIMAHQRFKA